MVVTIHIAEVNGNLARLTKRPYGDGYFPISSDYAADIFSDRDSSKVSGNADFSAIGNVVT